MSDTMPPNMTIPVFDNSLCTIDTCPIDESFYEYRPSLAMNSVMIALFAISLLANAVQGVAYRTWTFAIAMVLGNISEVIGYIGRVFSYKDPFAMNPFLVQIICLTIAPAFLAAGIYLCLSRIVIIFGTHLSRIAPTSYTRLFITCDFISLVLQGAGGGVASVRSQNYEDPALGNNIMIAGVAFQVFTLGLFMTLCADFAARVWMNGRSGNALNKNDEELRNSRRFRGFLAALTLATVCIMIRSIFRLIEMSQGWNGALQADQTLFFVLEGVMVIVSVFALNLFHPGMAMRNAYHIKSAWKAEKKMASNSSDLA